MKRSSTPPAPLTGRRPQQGQPSVRDGGIGAAQAALLSPETFLIRAAREEVHEVRLARQTAEREPETVTGDRSYTLPYGFEVGGMIPSIAARPTQRHMDVYGTTEEQFGAHVVTQRYHASLNEDAIFRDPITVDDYLASRYISKPVRLLDCDYPVDSASAVIYTSGDRARSWRKRPVWVEAAAYSSIKYFDFDNIDLNANSPFHAARELWGRTDLGPQDVDFAQLYDGFTIITFQWLEALGFCHPARQDRSSRPATPASAGVSRPTPTAGRATWAVATAPTSASSRYASCEASADRGRSRGPKSVCGPTPSVRSLAWC